MPEPQKQCPQCKTVQSLSAAFCVSCGRQFRTTAPHQPMPPDRTILVQPEPPPRQAPRFGRLIQLPPGRHSIFLAVFLALFCCPGVGQFYNRQIEKGGLFLIVSLAVAASAVYDIMAGEFSMTLEPLRVLSLGIWFAEAVDAGLIAARLYRGEQITEWQFF